MRNISIWPAGISIWMGIQKIKKNTRSNLKLGPTLTMHKLLGWYFSPVRHILQLSEVSERKKLSRYSKTLLMKCIWWANWSEVQDHYCLHLTPFTYTCWSEGPPVFSFTALGRKWKGWLHCREERILQQRDGIKFKLCIKALPPVT